MRAKMNSDAISTGAQPMPISAMAAVIIHGADAAANRKAPPPPPSGEQDRRRAPRPEAVERDADGELRQREGDEEGAGSQ